LFIWKEGSMNSLADKTMSVVTAVPKEQRNFIWKIENFEELVNFVIQKAEFVWFLHLSEVENEGESESVSEDDKERVGIYLGRLEDSKESTVSLYCQLSVDIVVNNRFILSKPGNKFIFNLIRMIWFDLFVFILNLSIVLGRWKAK